MKFNSNIGKLLININVKHSITVLEFWKHYGTEVIRSHIHSKAREAGTYIHTT